MQYENLEKCFKNSSSSFQISKLSASILMLYFSNMKLDNKDQVLQFKGSMMQSSC